MIKQQTKRQNNRSITIEQQVERKIYRITNRTVDRQMYRQWWCNGSQNSRFGFILRILSHGSDHFSDQKRKVVETTSLTNKVSNKTSTITQITSIDEQPTA